MPIRINLLAEAQAAEDLRRRDPVKRGMWVAAFLIFLMVLWILKLQLDIIQEHSSSKYVAVGWHAIEARYKAVTNNQATIRDVDGKLAQLDKLTTNRFLWGNVMNALQLTLVDHIQVTHVLGEQTYARQEAHDLILGQKLVHQPGSVVEKISLTIEAKDWAPNDNDYIKYKESLSNFDYFVKHLGRKDGFVIDGTLSQVETDPLDQSRQFVTFTIATHFPETHYNE